MQIEIPTKKIKSDVYFSLIPTLIIVNTNFLTQNINPTMYLKSIPTLTIIMTCFLIGNMRHGNQAGYKYLFFYPKYVAQYVYITGIFLSNKNMKCRGLIDCSYLFSHP